MMHKTKINHLFNYEIKKRIIILSITSKNLLLIIFCLFLLGCEASLNIEKINQELEKQVRRTDQFQGLSRNDSHLIAVGADGSNGLILQSALTSTNKAKTPMLESNSVANEIIWTRKIIAKQSTLIDVVACPDQSFIALATDKKIWRSSDNGSNWQAFDIPTQEDILALTCAPDNSIWVVGSFSTIMHSKDHGQSWNSNSLNEDAMLTSIHFLDEKTAMVVGEFGVFSRSDDAGLNWNPPEYIPNDFYVQNAHFNSVDEIWVGGLSGQILYTKNGGQNWTQQNTPTDSPIYGFSQTSDRLFAFGDHSTLLELKGEQWIAVNKKGKPVYLRDVLLLANGQLLLAGGSGSLYTQAIQTAKSLASNSHKD